MIRTDSYVLLTFGPIGKEIEMRTWPRLIQAELRSMRCKNSADLNILAEVDENDHVVGVLDNELCKLFLLYLRYYKRWTEKAEKHNLIFGVYHPELWFREEKILKKEARALKDNFWISCYHIFPELRFKPWLVIRKGWKIVWRDYSTVEKEEINPIAYTRGYSES